MRVGDFGIEVLAVQGDDIRELESGHVLARAGAVYTIRLRNFGPLRCVANVCIDDRPVTGGGLVLDAYGVVTLERPVDQHEHGRFTVVAEGDERVFGPDGGRDNPALGLIEGRFRRELPNSLQGERARPLVDFPAIPFAPSSRSMAPRDWSPPGMPSSPARERPDISAIAPASPAPSPAGFVPPSSRDIERAAGTGLTGHSRQEFTPVFVGPLEKEATVLHLRLVIGSDEAFAAPRPRRPTDAIPARPTARP